jgi:hypothetical protein
MKGFLDLRFLILDWLRLTYQSGGATKEQSKILKSAIKENYG